MTSCSGEGAGGESGKSLSVTQRAHRCTRLTTGEGSPSQVTGRPHTKSSQESTEAGSAASRVWNRMEVGL